MFGQKIFVQVQTFRRVPPVLPRNFCHPDCKLIKLFKAKLFHICPKLKECTVGWRYEKLIRLSKVLKCPNGKINSPDNNGHGEREMKRTGKIF